MTIIPPPTPRTTSGLKVTITLSRSSAAGSPHHSQKWMRQATASSIWPTSPSSRSNGAKHHKNILSQGHQFITTRTSGQTSTAAAESIPPTLCSFVKTTLQITNKAVGYMTMQPAPASMPATPIRITLPNFGRTAKE